MTLSWVALALAGLCLSIGIGDIRHRRVPNALLLLCLGFWAGLRWLQAPMPGAVNTDAGQAVLGAAVALALFFPLWLARAMGAGDVKFLAVLGVWFGAAGMLLCWAVASVIALLQWLVLRLAGASPTGAGRRGAPFAAYLAVGAMGWMWMARY